MNGMHIIVNDVCVFMTIICSFRKLHHSNAHFCFSCNEMYVHDAGKPDTDGSCVTDKPQRETCAGSQGKLD